MPAEVAQARPERRRLRRSQDRALVGGVCAGVAEYFEIEPIVVRLILVVVALAGGVGLGVYPLAWAVIPAHAVPEGASQRRSWRARFSGWREAIAIVLLAGLAILLLRSAGLWLGDEIVLPLVLASCGVALILRPAGGAQDAAGPPGTLSTGERPGGLRGRPWPGSVLGAVLVIAAAVTYLSETGILAQSVHPIGGLVVVAVAFALVFGPWLARLGRTVASERSERIRSQERTVVAAHLHDSVLQTLALIQRRADDPREVANLARRQERELRRWLFEPRAAPGSASLAEALRESAAEVEDLYGVRVEIVTVGDCPLDEALLAVVSAAREAMVNAAKFAHREEFDLFAEVDDGSVQVFIRDRGVGFDPATVPEDRRGVRHSILGRMQQHGGRAEVRSGSGLGTEVELTLERSLP